jgi:hypothetical protein
MSKAQGVMVQITDFISEKSKRELAKTRSVTTVLITRQDQCCREVRRVILGVLRELTLCQRTELVAELKDELADIEKSMTQQ